MRKFVLFLLIMPGCAIGYLNAQFVIKEHPIKDTDPIQAAEQDFLSPDDGGVYTEGAIPALSMHRYYFANNTDSQLRIEYSFFCSIGILCG
jgi:hypothetical protein